MGLQRIVKGGNLRIFLWTGAGFGGGGGGSSLYLAVFKFYFYSESPTCIHTDREKHEPILACVPVRKHDRTEGIFPVWDFNTLLDFSLLHVGVFLFCVLLNNMSILHAGKYCRWCQ